MGSGDEQNESRDDGQISRRQRVQTEKGKQYQYELFKKEAMGACTSLTKALNEAEILVSDSEKLDELKVSRQKIVDLMNGVSMVIEKFSAHDFPSSTSQFMDCNKIAERFHKVFAALNCQIINIRQEVQSQVSHRSGKSAGGQSGVSQSSTKERCVLKMAELSRLRTEMEFHEKEHKLQAELERLKMQKEMAATEAELKTLQAEENNEGTNSEHFMRTLPPAAVAVDAKSQRYEQGLNPTAAEFIYTLPAACSQPSAGLSHFVHENGVQSNVCSQAGAGTMERYGVGTDVLAVPQFSAPGPSGESTAGVVLASNGALTQGGICTTSSTFTAAGAPAPANVLGPDGVSARYRTHQAGDVHSAGVSRVTASALAADGMCNAFALNSARAAEEWRGQTQHQHLLDSAAAMEGWPGRMHYQRPLDNVAVQPPSQDPIERLADTLGRMTSPLQRLEPDKFNGDLLKFHSWLQSFEALVEMRVQDRSDLLYYLYTYTSGEPKELVERYLPLRSQNGYLQAKEALMNRYGSVFQTFNAYRDRLQAWPKIPLNNGPALRKYADFLATCCAAASTIPALRVLDDPKENQQLLLKLPGPSVGRWAAFVDDWRFKRISGGCQGTNSLYPSFRDFSVFVEREARMACDPVTSQQALRQCVAPQGQTRGAMANERRVVLAAGTDIQPAAPRERPSEVNDSRKSTAFGQRRDYECPVCGGRHDVATCKQFLQMGVDEREELVRKRGLCFLCLRTGHRRQKCKSNKRCTVCNGPHTTLLHKNRGRTVNASTVNAAIRVVSDSASERGRQRDDAAGTVSATTHKIKGGEGAGNLERDATHSLIVPVRVFCKDDPDKSVITYAVLDDQSDTCFASEDFLSKLGGFSRSVGMEMTIATITGLSTVRVRKVTDLVAQGVYEGAQVELPATFSRETIPVSEGQIPLVQTAQHWPHLNKMANNLMPYDASIGVGLLIGTSCSQALRPLEVIAGEPTAPYAVKTSLGWGIVGRVNREEADHPQVNSIPASCFRAITRAKEVVLPSGVEAMLEVDFQERRVGRAFSMDEVAFMKRMEMGMKRTDGGRFTAPLPLRGDGEAWPNNRASALCRLMKSKHKLMTNEVYFRDYCQFVQGMLEKGYAERVHHLGTPRRTWYLPHHGVYHPKKPDKFRVVFDCSAQHSECSLNKRLLQGPDLTENLVGLLYRFREESCALTCDIEKMFFQVSVDPSDRDLLRFLWWENGCLHAQPVEYRMTVHLFGASSSPSVANYALKAAASAVKTLDPEAARFIESCFYVDDGLISLPSARSLLSLAQRSRDHLAEYGFKLHKFVSNEQEVIASLQSDCSGCSTVAWNIYANGCSVERTLGVEWNVQLDAFQFSLSLKDTPLTRRGIMSSVYSIFDPLGLLAPFVLTGKLILQDLCRDGAEWDDPVPETVRSRWSKWRSEIPSLHALVVPRCYKPNGFGAVCARELHHFSDACLDGYGQCSYLKLVNENGDTACALVTAKARVAPIKALSVPRMELTAAVVSARVSELLQRELEECKHFFWTDSTVVLGYVRNSAKKFHTYVANRVQVIRDASVPTQWRHVRTNDNPADIASRGISAKALIDCDLWWQGPSFLKDVNCLADDEGEYYLSPEDPEVRKVALTSSCVGSSKTPSSLVERLTRYSTIQRAKTAIAMLFRLQRSIKQKKSEKIPIKDGPLMVEELRSAEYELIRITQAHYFGEYFQGDELKVSEPTTATQNRTCVTKGLSNLDPFVDSVGILRVGGRLSRASMDDLVKHPVILPRDAHISQLIVQDCHERVHHQGRSATIGELRSLGYWIVGATVVVKRLIYHCITCRRLRHSVRSQKLADLPAERLSCEPPFTYCGVDFFGPFYVKMGRSELKRYGVVFSCLSSRAVHLEVACSLSTDSFINAYRRFVCRRGSARQIFCDQGTNLVGGSNELREALLQMQSDHLQRELAKNGCDWVDFRFNPPHASHFGGSWERMIRSTRRILENLLYCHGRIMDDEALSTFMTEAECIMNCRPLSVDNLSDHSVEPLTPNHLLTAKCKLVLPPPGKFQEPEQYSRRRWRRVQFLVEQFWTRWRKEYVLNLQRRQKWHKSSRNFSVGDIVILQDDSSSRNHWPLARVAETYTSKDGLVRSVKLQMAHSNLDSSGKRTSEVKFLDRPIHKLVLLLEAD